MWQFKCPFWFWLNLFNDDTDIPVLMNKLDAHGRNKIRMQKTCLFSILLSSLQSFSCEECQVCKNHADVHLIRTVNPNCESEMSASRRLDSVRRIKCYTFGVMHAT